MKVRVLGDPTALDPRSSGEPEKAGGVLEGQHRTEFPDRHQLRQPGRDYESGPPSGSGCEGRKAEAVDAIDGGLHFRLSGH